MQTLVVALVVAGSFVYALWTLAPKAVRSGLANALLKWPLPGHLRKPLLAAARQQGGCGCDGCDKPVAAPVKALDQARSQPLVFVRKR